VSVGTCLLANEPVELKDALIQARIDGKTWKQIQQDFGFSSIQVARKNFRKITGINDLKIKGKDLKDALDNGMLEELKKMPPKKTKAIKEQVHDEAEAVAQAAFEGSTGTGNGLVGEQFDIMQKAFPGHTNKMLLENTDEVELYSMWSGAHEKSKITDRYADIVDDYGFAKTGEVANMIKQGKYYSDIKTSTGLEFEEIDAIFWKHTLDDAWTAGKPQNAIWDAYKQKPTSEYGFKAVQDTVWNMKKVGVSPTEISKATGVDKNVVDLILSDDWSLPTKGSKTYVGFSSPSSSYATPYSQTASQLVGESSNFKNMTQKEVDQWIQTLGVDMTDRQKRYWSSYSGSFYYEVNSGLRSGAYLTDTSRLGEATRDMKASMRPIPNDVTLHRGVDSNAFPHGVPDVGEPYVDNGFMSTSFGDRAAFGSRSYQIHIDAPAGTMARPIYNISGYGMSEREIVLDAGTKLVVTGVQKTGSQTHVYMKVVL
jgi:hypothetical protein